MLMGDEAGPKRDFSALKYIKSLLNHPTQRIPSSKHEIRIRKLLGIKSATHHKRPLFQDQKPNPYHDLQKKYPKMIIYPQKP